METAMKVYPHLMEGKKILYVHGFGSSGASGTVKSLRMLLPQAIVVAPDLPVRPAEAMDLLHAVCESEKPDLIIGSSMGGMYTEMLYGYDRILLNPAFELADTLTTNNKIGRQEFYNPRVDGAKDFLVTKGLIAEFREVSGHCFEGVCEEEQSRVYGLFGDKDPLVHTHDLFAAHYRQALWFDGEHYMNDHVLMRSVLPVVHWIDDRQEGRERPILYVALDDTLMDTVHDKHEPVPTAVKAFQQLAQVYDIYVLAHYPAGDASALSEQMRWVEHWLGVPAWNRLVLSNHKNLAYGDYLIDAHADKGASEFMGTFMHFGEDPYKTWDDVLEFFSRLGGQ